VVFDGVIDVSHHNGAIDWPAVAAAGIALAFIKATQGTRFVDPAFEQNRAAATSAGVLAVPYHFIDEDDPEDEAAHFLSVACLGAGQPAMIDWENSAPVCDVVALGRPSPTAQAASRWRITASRNCRKHIPCCHTGR
jgi:GH25 family lysozyme M1 (1,4-beta-N-acetylmuramidase)